MPRKPSIAIVGPGKLGSALAVSLRRAGYRIAEIISRPTPPSLKRARALAKPVGASATSAAAAHLDADLVWFCVNDDQIAASARGLAGRTNWVGKYAFHSSGALTSSELDVLRRKGARVASVHPMTSFARGPQTSLKNVCFGVEGDAVAVRLGSQIVRQLGGESFRLRPESKVLYHASGSFASPMMVSVLGMAERVAVASGITKAFIHKALRPLIKETVNATMNAGAAAAFAGPIQRGDVATVAKHLEALKAVPGAREIYRLLAKNALQMFPVKNRKALARLLERQ